MKKRFLITTALAMVLGVGVAVGAHQSQRVEKAEAADNVTLYCKMPYDWWWAKGGWGDEDAGIGVHYWKEYTATTYPGIRGTKLETDPKVWKFEVPSDSQGFCFTRINAEGDIKNWGAKTDDLTFPTNGKNLYTITSQKATWWTSDYHTVDGIWGNLYTVTTHVRGETEVVSVAEGELPANPSLAFGESFDGWFDNEACTEGHEVTAITSDQTVYAKITSCETKTYTLDTSRVSTVFTSKNLYAFDSHGNNGEFPGVALDSNTFSVPSSATIIISNGNGAQTVDVTQSGVDNDVLRILNKQDGGKYKVLWESAADEPAEDGYYLVGSKTDNKFAGAVKLSTTDIEPGNIAELHGYEGKKGETIKVRSFFNEEAVWSYYNGGEKDFGAGDQYANFVFSKDQKVNIYAKYEGNPSQLNFYVERAYERYEVTLTKVLHAGSRRIGEAEGGSVYAYDNEAFNPTTKFAPTHDGYVFRGKYYTDADCTIEYVSAVPTADLHLYALFTKVGYYVISEAGYWAIDNAILMDSPDNPNNKAEAAITVEDVGEAYSFVYYDGEMHGHAGLGANYEFVVNEESHIKFTKVGSYAIYWSNGDNKLYVNAGLEAFYTNFLNSVGGACHSDGIYAEGELQAVKDAWSLQEAAYNALTTEEQNTIKAIGFDPDSESQDQSVRMVKMYSYIVKKYGTEVFNDFIWNQDHAGEHPFILAKVSNVKGGAATIIYVIIGAVGVSIIAGLFYLRKTKEK